MEAKLPRYCPKCGKELVKTVKHLEFDMFAGHPVHQTVTLVCPDFKAHEFLPWLSNGHFRDMFYIDER